MITMRLRLRPHSFTLAVFLALAARAVAAPAEFFVLWQGSGAWQCTLTIEGGTILRAEPYMFLDPRDRVERDEPQRVVCTTNSRGNSAGLRVFANAEPGCTVRLETNRATERLALADFPTRDAKVVPVAGGAGFLLFGRGDPARGPQEYYREQLPATFVPPTPRNAIALPAEWWRGEAPVRVALATTPPGEVSVRRVARHDGMLYLEVFSPAGALKGPAQVVLGAQSLGSAEIDGSLWLALAPRIGRIAVAVKSPAGTQNLSVATTLVETRGNRIFVNGEPFLIKGTLAGELTADDAEFIRELGMNTLRGGGGVIKEAEQYGFMNLASIQGRQLRPMSDYKGARGREALAKDLERNYAALVENARPAAESPYTLISQLDNERTAIGANPLEPDANNTGADPWSDFVRGDDGEFVRLNRILAEDWNRVKPLAPAIPLGYANETQGYLPPAFLDVYMHNTYLPRDRYGIPLRDFARLQGGDWRPFVNSEWGANRFTPESYHGAKNTPLLEKIQAWGYRQTWVTFMDAGTVGGTSYRLYDGTGVVDQGTKNFGLMTADRQPKLACWELWHMWRDFEIAPATGNDRAITVSFKRDYAARDCRLTLRHDGKDWPITLGDVPPHGWVTVPLPFASGEFRWRIDYATHGGLKTHATGAWPARLEEEDFAQRLAKRDAPAFLRALMTARVLTAQGQDAPPALVDMMGADGIIPVAFQCADGTIYVTAFSRRRLRGTHYVKADIRTAFAGEVVQVDEWTGQPLSAPVAHEVTAAGLVFKDVAVPSIPGPIAPRSSEPVSLPVFRIQPGRAAQAAAR